jgi:hypothetical protein
VHITIIVSGSPNIRGSNRALGEGLNQVGGSRHGKNARLADYMKRSSLELVPSPRKGKDHNRCSNCLCFKAEKIGGFL